MIRSDLKKVRNLLDESIKYVVPTYQRNFEWKRDQAEEFFEDISSGSVFLGTIVLDTSKERDGEIYIVDGQQRITTIFIFLSACKYHAQNVKSEAQALEIYRKISFIDDTSGRASSSKLIPSPSIAAIFEETIANHDWDGKRFELKNKKRQASKLRPIYEYFVDKISKMDKDDLAELLKKLYESTFIKIEVQEEREAFEIFERTNARGMELNAADLLKNYLFARSASTNLTEDWDLIVDNSDGNITRLIKYYYVSNFGLVRKSELFKEMKNHGESIGPDRLLVELKEFSYHYNLILNGNKENLLEWASETDNDFYRKEYNLNSLHRVFEALRLFGVSQGHPLLVKCLHLLDGILDSKEKIRISETILDLFQAIEKFHFLNYAISQRPGNQIEEYYANKCKVVINEDNFSEFSKEIVTELRKEKVVGEAEFIEKFSELTYGTDSPLIYYIYDRFNNRNRKGAQYSAIYNPDKKLLRKNYDIDHLIAQDTSEYNFNKEDLADYMDTIGNLLVISKHTNGSLQNKSITEKLKILSQLEARNLPEAQLLVEEWADSKWSSVHDVIDNIKERTESLAIRAFKECWKI